MTTLAAQDAQMFFRALGALHRTHSWVFHAKAGWAFDVWTLQTRHGWMNRSLVLLPDFGKGTVAVYLAGFNPGMFKANAQPPASLHVPFTVTVTGRHWQWMAKTLDDELMAVLGIEQATGLARMAA